MAAQPSPVARNTALAPVALAPPRTAPRLEDLAGMEDIPTEVRPAPAFRTDVEHRAAPLPPPVAGAVRPSSRPLPPPPGVRPSSPPPPPPSRPSSIPPARMALPSEPQSDIVEIPRPTLKMMSKSGTRAASAR